MKSMVMFFWGFSMMLVGSPAASTPKAPDKAPDKGPTTRLCAHAVEKGGTLACAFELTADVAKRRQYLYRFTEQGGRVLKVEVVNSAGHLFDRTVPPPARLVSGTVEYRWSAAGRLEWAVFHRQEGGIRERWKVTGTTRDLYRPPVPGETDPETARVKGAGPSREKWTVDAKGFLKTVRYFNWKDEPRKDDNDEFGLEFERDAAGLVVAEYPLDRTGKRTKGPDGQVKYTWSRDARGNLLGSGAVDERGKPSKPRSRRILANTHDAAGNLVGERYFDLDSKPTADYRGIFGWKGTLDAAGNLVELRFIDAEGKPAKSHSGIYGERYTVDARGWFIGWCNLGADGKSVADPEGITCVRYTVDARDRIIERRFLDAAGRPSTPRRHPSITRWKYSSDDLRLEKWFFDATDKPALDAAGFHGEVRVESADGLKVETCHHGLDGKKMGDKYKISCTRTVLNHDDRIVELWYFDAQDKLVLNEDKIAGSVFKYNDDGRREEEWYYGTRRELILHPELQYAGLVTKWDAEGEVVSMIKYDTDRKPMEEPAPAGESDEDGPTQDEGFGHDPDQGWD